jgi:hypothetical protein
VLSHLRLTWLRYRGNGINRSVGRPVLVADDTSCDTHALRKHLGPLCSNSYCPVDFYIGQSVYLRLYSPLLGLGRFSVSWSYAQQMPITAAVRPKGAHTRTSLACESGSARVPMSQTRLYVGRKVGSPLMRVWWNISEPGSRVRLAEPDSYVYGHLKAWTIFASSSAGIVGSNPTWGMDVCLRLFCLCCSVCRWRPCDRLILRRRSPTDCI